MSNLRIIGGTARGRRLKSVPGASTRPITDRVREALFNILGADIQAATFLDLFAGTGSVGIEALSRGASYVRFIDRNHLAIATLKYNLEHTGLGEGAEVVRMDAFTLLERHPDREFDYVYIAPPQYKELWKRALISLDRSPSWLSEDAWVIVQIHPREYVQVETHQLEEFDQRRYGSTVLVFYKRMITTAHG
ncbi:MAG: 16S rRNA (guanine(966)-N(2))-methyltransferase RsmD [Anaerolineales bacterium]